MNKQELVTAFQNRIEIGLLEIGVLSELWNLYRQNNIVEMIKIGRKLKDRFPFLEPAIYAHKERFPQNGAFGRPELSIIEIIKEHGYDDFGKIFRAFCKQESIYGFGDLHVRRLYDEITKVK